MDVDDFQKLHSELRGSSCSKALVEARSYFLERQMHESLAKLVEAHQTYREGRQRILKQDPQKDVDPKAKDRDRQIKRLKRKQEKAREILQRFEEMVAELQKLAAREKTRLAEKLEKDRERAEARQNKSDAETGRAAGGPDTVVRRDSLGDQFLEQFANLTGDRQLSIVSHRYGFRSLQSTADVEGDAVYLMHDGDHSHLFVTRVDSQNSDQLECRDPATDESLGAISRDAMVQLSADRKLVLLLEKQSTEQVEARAKH